MRAAPRRCGGGASGGEDAPAWNHDRADAELGPAQWSDLDETFEQCAIGGRAPEVAGEEVEVDLGSPLTLLGVADATTAYGGDYATYAGSLTTPRCTEGVRWIVTSGAMPTPSAAIDRLHELIADFPGYDGYENNNRPTQPLNEREIRRDGG